MVSDSRLEGRLCDAQGRLIGVVRVSNEHGLWSGEIDLAGVAPALVSLFTRYEELVNGQMLSLVEEIEVEISQIEARLFVSGERQGIPVSDLQIYPSQRDVSFRLS